MPSTTTPAREAAIPHGGTLLAAAPLWRREPYRIFFPLGALLAWAGILHWLLHALGLLADYQPVFHSIAQIQGFMICFAVGFLFTAIPRRTGTAPPAAWQMAVALAAPIATTIAAWFQWWALSQLFWLALVIVLVSFAVRRFLGAEAARRPPNSFVWVPLSLAMGTAGSLLIAIGGMTGRFSLHDLGRLLLLQGMFTGLVVGVGGMVLPLVTRGDAPPDAAASRVDILARAGHVLAALLLVASFFVENYASQRAGYALRAAIVLAVLLISGRIWRYPLVPGWHRWLVWISGWMIPLGYALAAIFPLQWKAGIHIVFIGGFALMAFAVGLHVTLAHGGYQRLVRGRPWQVPVFGGLLLAAMAARVLAEFDKQRYFVWIGSAAAIFLTGTLFWGALLVPRLLGKPGPEEAQP